VTKIIGKYMKKKLSKHGNSLALIIDKPLLKLLSINKNTVLNITIDNNKIIIEAPSKRKKIIGDDKMQKIYEDLVEKYAPALKKLAKN
jgi:antitoxin component of MazEF toxin-antitoxin module